MADEKIRIGVSACLLGERVRFDGQHKRDPYIVNTLGEYFEFVPVCPEVELGLPIPRPALRLVGEVETPRLVFSRSGEDITEAMQTWAQQRVQQLAEENLCGFIFKKGSPSSGMERVKVYQPQGMPHNRGIGVFARAFMAHFPLLPVEEDGRLHDAQLRENFIESLFTLRRWRLALAASHPSLAARVIDFHRQHKLLIMAHSVEHYRQMGKLVAQAGTLQSSELVEAYQQLLLQALRLKATPAKQINVMQHIMGYFKKQLSGDEKQELLQLLNAYRAGHVPLVVPITLLNHYVRKYDQAYLAEQTYLNPHPQELKLRCHV